MAASTKRPTYYERKAQGLCVSNGCPYPAREDTVLCEKCRTKRRAYNAKKYRTDPTLRTYYRKAMRKRVAKRQALGLCVRCTEPAVTSYYCRKHQIESGERARSANKRPLKGRTCHCSFCGQLGHRVPTCPVRLDGGKRRT